jgi:hypothetical protein
MLPLWFGAKPCFAHALSQARLGTTKAPAWLAQSISGAVHKRTVCKIDPSRNRNGTDM